MAVQHGCNAPQGTSTTTLILAFTARPAERRMRHDPGPTDLSVDLLAVRVFPTATRSFPHQITQPGLALPRHEPWEDEPLAPQ